MPTITTPQLIDQFLHGVHRKLPLAERTKTEGSLDYASVFPDWVTHHTIFSSVDSVIRCVGTWRSTQNLDTHRFRGGWRSV